MKQRKLLSEWSEGDVVEWLHEKGGILTKFVRTFEEFHIDGALLDTMSQQDLVKPFFAPHFSGEIRFEVYESNMGVTNPMEIKCLLRARDRLIKKQVTQSEKKKQVWHKNKKV